MIVYALSDLHLSFAAPKPMDIFGSDWKDHHKKIAESWDGLVKQDDVVLVAGDVSWAMKLEDAWPDLEYLAARPGRKVLIRGNHDYWWSRRATTKIQNLIDPSITLLQGTSVVFDDIGVAGTRGWRLEDYELDTPQEGDVKIYEREIKYLAKALESLPENAKMRIAMLHYPPYDLNLEPNEFHKVLEDSSVDILVYGHVHKGTGSSLEGDVNGIRYHLTSADCVGFKPVRILDTATF